MPRVNVPGVGAVNFPDSMSPEEIRTAIETEILPKAKKRATTGSSPEEMARVGLEGMGPLDKLAVNFGAGLDAARKGVSGLLSEVGIGNGPSDEEIKAKRVADAALADQTTGGWLTQLAGEIAPMLAVPGAGFVRGGQAALKGAGMLKNSAPIAARLGTTSAVADAGIGGAITGAATMADSDESRIANALVGAVGGAAASSLVAGGRSVWSMLSGGGAERKAAEKLVEMAGGPDEAQAVLDKLRNYNPGRVTRDIPMSVAEISQNPGLARGERAAAAADKSGNWIPFRQEQATERAKALREVTDNDLAGAKTARRSATAPMRDSALNAAATGGYATDVQRAIDRMLGGEAGTNPAIQTVGRYVASTLGDDITPERLYTVRKVLLKNMSGKPKLGDDDVAAAIKQTRAETMGLVKSIDAALDDASGGMWTPYLKKYASKSGEVTDAEALTMIRKYFSKGGSPRAITGERLDTAVERFGQNNFGDKLSSGSRANLKELRDNVEMSEGLQKLVKFAGTSGGGSNTAMDVAGMAVGALDAKTGGLLGVLRKLAGNSDATQAALSDALRNPDLFISGVSRKLAQMKPLSRSEEIVLGLLRSTGTAGVLDLAAPQ